MQEYFYLCTHALKKLWKQKNHAPRNKNQVSYLCIALRCKDNFSWFFKKINTSKTPYVAIDERGLVRSIHLFLFSCVH